MESMEQARDRLEAAVRARPDNFVAQRNLARARFALQDLEASRLSAEELSTRFPDAAFTHLFSGHLYKALGDTQLAWKSYRRALDQEPTLGEALYNLVDLAADRGDETLSVRAAELADREDVPAADRINAGFACARILDRKGAYGKAFEYLLRSNGLAREDMARRGLRYDPRAVEASIAETIAEYPASSFGHAIDPLPIDIRPVFVIGMPRSGTTLVEQILASHADVQAGGELLLGHECERAFRRNRISAGRIDPSQPADAGLLESLRERYMDGLFERNLAGKWVVDKLPANFRIAGFLRTMFPDAPIVHCIRDARATAYSLFAANFGAHDAWKHDLGNLAHYFRQYRRLMAHWRTALPQPWIDVVYEDLVREPENRIRGLLGEVGMTFDPACLEFHRQRRPVLTASHAQVQRPIYTESLEHWRNYADWLGPVLDLADD